LPSPIVIHVLRPYASVEEYLTREGFSISAKWLLLIDQPALPVDTPVVFDVTLANGEKPIRAEGVVLSHVPAEGDSPGGLRVRFKRFGAATKAFVARASAGSTSSANWVAAAALVNSAASAAALPASAPTPSLSNPADSDSHATTQESSESSGVHQKVSAPLAAPADREALLARLRGRRAG